MTFLFQYFFFRYRLNNFNCKRSGDFSITERKITKVTQRKLTKQTIGSFITWISAEYIYISLLFEKLLSVLFCILFYLVFFVHVALLVRFVFSSAARLHDYILPISLPLTLLNLKLCQQLKHWHQCMLIKGRRLDNVSAKLTLSNPIFIAHISSCESAYSV